MGHKYIGLWSIGPSWSTKVTAISVDTKSWSTSGMPSHRHELLYYIHEDNYNLLPPRHELLYYIDEEKIEPRS
jgi:hypothetical protein